VKVESATPVRTPGETARWHIPHVVLVSGVVILLVALWLAALTHQSGDSGSLDSRALAVGATVRCPICQQGIPLNDVANPQADAMRAKIHDELRQGLSESQVRQYLVAQYGPSILLAPPQQGFDALVWFVPLLVVASCAVGLLLSIRRWSTPLSRATATPGADGPWPSAGAPGPEGSWQGADPEGPVSGEARRYEDLLDRELQRRG
jgi:cytochrome c-type biogenesis protein CcmH